MGSGCWELWVMGLMGYLRPINPIAPKLIISHPASGGFARCKAYRNVWFCATLQHQFKRKFSVLYHFTTQSPCKN